MYFPVCRYLLRFCILYVVFGGLIISHAAESHKEAEKSTEKLIVERPVPARIPVTFSLERPGEVTLVVDDATGKRVRNLISSKWFEAGKHTVMWDGLDESIIEPVGVMIRGKEIKGFGGINNVKGKPVGPGVYQVRGLVRDRLDLIYEFAPYSPGEPPWPLRITGPYRTAAGGWLADHGIPSDILYFPPEKGHYPKNFIESRGGQFMVVSPAAEEGQAFVWLDAEGKKLYGERTINAHGGFIGAQLIARDRHEVDPNVFAYVASGWGQKAYLTAMHRTGHPRKRDKPLLKEQLVWEETAEKTVHGTPNPIRGFAVDRGLAVVSLHVQNKLLFINVEEGEIIGEYPLKNPAGVTFTDSGKLLALGAGNLSKLTLNWQDPEAKDFAVTSTQRLTKDGQLDSPQQIIVDDIDGTIYVSMWGDSNQIQVLDAKGTPLRRIGKPGPLALGAYDPLHMNTPYGMTLDGEGMLWVVEWNRAPRRLSRWTPEGKLLKAIYGSSKYGGGGRIDPSDPTKFYLVDGSNFANAGLQFRLDWEKGKATLESIYARYNSESFVGFFRESSPQMPIHRDGFTYLTDSLNQNPVMGARQAGLWRLDKDKIARPVSAVGNPLHWEALQTEEYAERFEYDHDKYAVKNSYLFTWSDLNGDGKPEPSEVEFQKRDWGASSFTLQPDLSVISETGVRIPVREITPKGVPIYDLAAAETLVPSPMERRLVKGGTSQVVGTTDGFLIATGGPMSGFRDGKLVWTYPSRWPSLQASHHAPRPSSTGEMIGTTRILGWPFKVQEGEAGVIWAVNGNKGSIYLMTSDGLFLGELGMDKRLGKPVGHDDRTTTAQRGMSVRDYTFKEEHFYPTMNSTPEGKIYLVAGKSYAGIFRIDGLDTTQRLDPIKVEVTQENMARMVTVDGKQMASLSFGGKPSLTIPIGKGGRTVDAQLDDWKDAKWATIEPGLLVSAKVVGNRLFVAYRSDDAELILNEGSDPEMLFLSGGGLDLMLRTDPRIQDNLAEPIEGDLRLLVAQKDGKPIATLYEAVVPGTEKNKRHEFASPKRSIFFDRVREVSSEIELAGQNGIYEFSFPLKKLGLNPQVGKTILADFGVLRGDGGTTSERVYWANKGTGITSDIPSEAMLSPGSWGVVSFVYQPSSSD